MVKNKFWDKIFTGKLYLHYVILALVLTLAEVIRVYMRTEMWLFDSFLRDFVFIFIVLTISDILIHLIMKD